MGPGKAVGFSRRGRSGQDRCQKPEEQYQKNGFFDYFSHGDSSLLVVFRYDR
jgi:hypothetical protein